MKYILRRYASNQTNPEMNHTVGNLYPENRVFTLYTLEDMYRPEKVAGETRIPAGKYEIVFQNIETRKTIKYREKYSWFSHHFMLKGNDEFQKNWTSVYIHIGNTAADTEGCILCATTLNIKTMTLLDSTEGFKLFYLHAYSRLSMGEKLELEIIDADFITGSQA